MALDFSLQEYLDSFHKDTGCVGLFLLGMLDKDDEPTILKCVG